MDPHHLGKSSTSISAEVEELWEVAWVGQTKGYNLEAMAPIKEWEVLQIYHQEVTVKVVVQ